jgi:hypothetical protein
MKVSILPVLKVALLGLVLSSCVQKESEITEESFFGEWYTLKGDLDAYSFLKDENSYIFVGIQGLNPIVIGTWKIENERFIITIDNGNSTEYSFNLSNDTLIFNNGTEIYTRTLPLHVKYPEVKILLALAVDLDNLRFSEPQPADLSWGYLVDSTKTIREFLLKGYSVSAGSTLSSDDIQGISDFIIDYGFEPDTTFVTEIGKGFWESNQIITVCISKDNEVGNDSINIIVTSGLIVK